MVRMLCVVLWSSMAVAAEGERRDGGKEAAALEVSLPFAAQFGDVVVPQNRFRVGVSGNGIVLTDVKTMVTVATLAAQTEKLDVPVGEATAELLRKGDEVTLLVRSQDSVFRVSGKKTEVANKRQVALNTKKTEHAVHLSGEEEVPAEQLVTQAMARYGKEIEQCGDDQERRHWKSNDAKFIACACPFVDKWRMPKVKADLTYVYTFPKKQSGVAFVVTPKGRARDCRVWAGEPPATETKVETKGKP